ncbi:uncharacterized protein LOC135336877 [Halichondria panicea]|uniref:uncharacterized protein LOC135336877 n=1 Tax=Halichondria panicea TaxID=6063 RepID=UPI00312B4460
MLSRNILSWLVLLTLAAVTRSEHYHIVPVDSTDLCNDYRNGTCFTLEQLVQTDLLSGGDNLTLSFLPGNHMLTEQLLIRNFSHVHITGQKKSTTIVIFHSNGVIHFISITELSIDNLGFVGANVGPQNSHQMLIIDSANNIYIDNCKFSDFDQAEHLVLNIFALLDQVETHIVKIANTQTAIIESTLFINNTGRALHVEADNVYITNSEFTRNDGGAVYIKSNNILININNAEFNYNSAENGGAVEVVSGTVVITRCTFTNNKASQFGGGINVGSGSSVSISDSTLTNNAADYGGAIYARSRSVFISDCELTNNRARRRGGAIHVYKGKNVSISNSTLTNNKAGGSGGAIRVESSSLSIFESELTNNRARRRGGAIHVYKGKNVSISNSTLTNNKAGGSGGAIRVESSSLSIFESELTNNSAKRNGGAIRMLSGNMFISKCEVTNNRVEQNGGGAIRVGSGNVSISECKLTNNRAKKSGGAIYVSSGNVSISDCTFSGNVSISEHNGGVYEGKAISDSTLTNNYGTVIAVFRQSTLIINNTNITNSNGPIYAFGSRVEFIGPTTLSNNRGVLGGTISLDRSQMYINTEGVIITNNTAISGGGIFLRESTLFVNKPIEIYHNTAHNGGGIYAYSSIIKFNKPYSSKQSEIANNTAKNGGGIQAVSSTIELIQSYVNIDSNTAKASGGGMYLQQSSKLYHLFKKIDKLKNTIDVKLMINNNLAQYGGGIFVEDDTQTSACGREATETIFSECFIQTIELNQRKTKTLSYFITFMANNTATQSGADIYGGLLDRCIAKYHIYSLNGLEYIIKTVKSSSKLSISSRPVQVIICNNDHISSRKGHMFRISVMAIDQVGNPTNATIHSSVISESGFVRLKEGQAKQEVGNQCTELEYNVFSQDRSAQVELYAEGPCINLGISRQLINISFLPCTCLIGLKPIQSDIECKCDCDPDLQVYQITNCSEENGTIKLESNNNIWIQFINTTNETGYVVSNCAFDYCVEKPVHISLSNPDEQCAYNRSGVLCGECEPGLNLVLATSNCKECSNLYLLLLIPFALAGILLVALILVLNITIATGNIHGLIFYANVVAANRAIFFPSVKNFLTVFVSWVNLDLGIEICFYNGMNSQGKALIQLVFPTYLFFLMLLIILLSKYFDSFSKLLSNRNPVAALGTLVLLSYSKFLRFIVAALQYTELHYPDGSTKTVWLFDGNVQYFTFIHIPQFIAAIIILIAGGLFTVMLFFGQWFPRCSKVIIWTKNTYYNGFMDAYHAPFTPKHRYWVGLLLFALIAHNLVVSMAPNTSLPVLSAGCIAFGLITLTNRVHKKQFNEYIETFFLLNLGILSIGTSYVVETHQQQETLTIVSMSIAFILFVIIISYHFYHFILKTTKIWLKIKEVTKKLRIGATEKKNQQPKNAMAMHQLAANDDDEQLNNAEQINIVNPPPYTNGAMEEADPDRYITPPIIRPATRPEQLRLSYMDELAPLTTEDYRPAPPPPRVNRRPAVTYTEITGPCAQ